MTESDKTAQIKALLQVTRIWTVDLDSSSSACSRSLQQQKPLTICLLFHYTKYLINIWIHLIQLLTFLCF